MEDWMEEEKMDHYVSEPFKDLNEMKLWINISADTSASVSKAGQYFQVGLEESSMVTVHSRAAVSRVAEVASEQFHRGLL